MREAFLTKKMSRRVEKPENCGFFTEEEAKEREMQLIVGNFGNLEEGLAIRFYWLVDMADGGIADAKFQVFGHPFWVALADISCDMMVGKNYAEGKRLSVEMLEKIAAESSEEGVFLSLTEEIYEMLATIRNMVSQCEDLKLPQKLTTPLPREARGQEGFPGWLALPREKKIEVIETLFNEEIRPYIEMDEGGIEIVDLVEEKELIIAYKGACTSCYSSIGATLSSIQEIVRERIHPDLIVVPNLEDLHF